MDISKDAVVVVPTIRETSINGFLDAWQWPCQVIVVEDNPERSFQLPPRVDHYAWQDIEADLGNDAWIIPRRSDCVRSYGYWKAWQTGKPYILTLDDDCLPVDLQHVGNAATYRFTEQHLNNLQPATITCWYSTLDGVYPRGYPYERWQHDVSIGISHGLWRGVLDLDSLSQLHYGRAGQTEAGLRDGLVPFGQYFPMCGMNLAWRREYTPLMYFLLMGQDAAGNAYPFDRFGDIWAGVIAKRVLDHLGVAVWSGAPFVRHERASNVWTNFRKEHAGIIENERFWQRIDNIRLWETDPRRCYRQIADQLPGEGYWKMLALAMRIWAALYE